MTRHRIPLRLVVCALLWLTCASVACRGAPESDVERGRVLLVGIDGATLRVAHPLIRKGELPNLESIARAGVFGPLRAHFPLVSPRIWTSIATGKLPEKHGILAFAHQNGDGEPRLYVSSDRKTHALWNIASAAGLTVGVVNWWNTYPVEVVNGVLVSDHLLPMDVVGRERITHVEAEDAGPITYPVEWAARLDALRDGAPSLTGLADPFEDADGFPKWTRPDRLSLRWHNDELVARIALEIEREIHPDVMMVFLPGIDRVSHALWGAIEPADAYPKGLQLSEAQRVRMYAGLRDYYVYTDALIGRLLEAYGPNDLVMVVSDHGFEAGQGFGFLTGNHETAKAANGVVFARGPGVSAAADPVQVTVNDVTPTILAWLGLPIGVDMDGAPAKFVADAVNAERIATHDTTAIERFGTVPSGAEDEILDQLKALGYLEHGRE